MITDESVPVQISSWKLLERHGFHFQADTVETGIRRIGQEGCVCECEPVCRHSGTANPRSIGITLTHICRLSSPISPVHWSVPRPQGSNVGPSLRRGVMPTEDDEAGCCFLRSDRPQGHSGIAVRIFAHCVKMERPLASGGTECIRRGCPSSVTASAYEPSMCPSRRPCL